MNREATIAVEKTVEELAPKRRFRSYPDYRDSSIEWMRRVPEHWSPARIIDHVRLINGYPFDSAQFSRDSGTPLVRIRDILRRNTEVCWTGLHVPEAEVDDGDVLIGMDGEFNVGWWLGGKAVLNQRVCCLRAKGRLNQRYLYYLIPAPLRAINGVTYSTTVKHLSSFDVLKVRFALPSPDEQRAIAAFLDRETARIDELTAKKQRLIELLAEKRTALISHAVTKGLNPDAPMKDSGIETLGSVPAHWDVKALGVAVRYISYGFTNPMPTSDVGPYMVTANDIGDGHVRFDSARRTTEDAYRDDITNKSRPQLGDILVTKDGTLGRLAVCDGTRLCINQSVALLRIREEVASIDFVHNALRARAYQDQMVLDAGGTTIKHIYITRLVKMRVAFPSKEERHEICSFVNSSRRQLNALIQRVHEAILKLREYRSALISAAVTGKIDVRYPSASATSAPSSSTNHEGS